MDKQIEKRERRVGILPIDLAPGRPFRDLVQDLNARLKAEIAQSGEDGFSWVHYLPMAHQVMPKAWSWIACYAVKGGSEGYWVHIDLILRDDDRRQNIAMSKVWSWEAAFNLANAATRILHEY